MQKKIASGAGRPWVELAVGLVVVAVCSSVVSALPAMGPPKALVGQDQWAIGLGYSYSQMDLEASGKSREDPGSEVWGPWLGSKHDIQDLTSSIVLGQLGYGVAENLDVFVCLGVSDVQDDMKESVAGAYPGDKYTGLDSGFGLAWGLGARATFLQDGDVTWGGLIQVIWENPSEGDIKLSPEPPTLPNPLTGDAELDLREIQVAVGPTLQLQDFCIYGGPFLHFVDGDIEASVSGLDSSGVPPLERVELSEDIQEESVFGVYAGLQGEASENMSWYAEYRMTGDAWGVGIGAVRRFK
jgi:opacity protein-like surface antigen